jgi:hypothetical protein
LWHVLDIRDHAAFTVIDIFLSDLTSHPVIAFHYESLDLCIEFTQEAIFTHPAGQKNELPTFNCYLSDGEASLGGFHAVFHLNISPGHCLPHDTAQSVKLKNKILSGIKII